MLKCDVGWWGPVCSHDVRLGLNLSWPSAQPIVFLQQLYLAAQRLWRACLAAGRKGSVQVQAAMQGLLVCVLQGWCCLSGKFGGTDSQN